MKLFTRTICVVSRLFAAAMLIWVVYIVEARSVAAQGLKPMVFGVSVKSVTFSPLFIAEQMGYFRQEGIAPKFVIMASDIAVKGLVTGDVDFAASTTSVAKAAAVGFPVKIVLNFFNGSLFYLVTRPGIGSIEELRGKTVAISRFGSATDFDARATFRHFGLDPSRDVKIIAVGGGGNRLAALVSKRVDGAILEVSEKIEAERAGMKSLLFTGQYFKQTITGLGASSRKIESRRDDIKRGVRAVYRAMGAMNRQVDLAKEFFEKELNIRPEQTDEVYQTAMRVFTPSGTIDLKDVAVPYEDARKGVIDPPAVSLSDLVDWSIVREIQEGTR